MLSEKELQELKDLIDPKLSVFEIEASKFRKLPILQKAWVRGYITLAEKPPVIKDVFVPQIPFKTKFTVNTSYRELFK